MNTDFIFLILTGALAGAASGYLGSYMVLKRMSLVGDALSHVALPGMAIALTFSLNPIVGAIMALTFAVFGIWYLGEKTEVYSEALVGVFFTASLAMGILITPEPELLEALFGNIENINLFDGLVTICGSILIFFGAMKLSDRLLLGVVSEDLARSMGVKMHKVNLAYLLLVGLVVALGVKFVGTLLTGALVIVPAVAAKNMTKSVRSFQIMSSVIGVASAACGILVAQSLGVAPGPIVVLISISAFLLSLLFKN